MSNTIMTSAGTMIEAGFSKRHARQVTFHESQEADFVDLEAGPPPALFQDISAELSDGPAVPQVKSRQNSWDFCIDRWKEHDAAALAEEAEEKAASEKQDEAEATVEHLEVILVNEPPKAHARPSRYRLSDYLPGFAGDADSDCQEIELGQYPDAVRQGPVREPSPSTVSGSKEAPERLLDRLVRCFTQ